MVYGAGVCGWRISSEEFYHFAVALITNDNHVRRVYFAFGIIANKLMFNAMPFSCSIIDFLYENFSFKALKIELLLVLLLLYYKIL